MPIRAITFDCAQTLVDVNWNPDQFAVSVAESIGVATPPNASEVYRSIHTERMPEFLALNLRRDPNEAKVFYRSLNRDWLSRIGADPNLSKRLTDAAETRAFGPGSTLFRLYEDTITALTALKRQGYVLAVVSNWDCSLHRVLKTLGLKRYFSASIASLEEGVEKPDPELFRIALKRIRCSPSEVLHIGDDPHDDVGGAQACGMQVFLIDRERSPDLPFRISSLLQISEAISCLG